MELDLKLELRLNSIETVYRLTVYESKLYLYKIYKGTNLEVQIIIGYEVLFDLTIVYMPLKFQVIATHRLASIDSPNSTFSFRLEFMSTSFDGKKAILPLWRTFPFLTSVLRSMVCSSVVFPAPELPVTPMN